MKRIPSIHITEDKLALVLKQVLEIDESPIEIDYSLLAKNIVRYGNKYSSVGRSMVVSDRVLERKAEQIVVASKIDTILIADLIHKKRLKLRHKGVKKMTQDHRDWPDIRKLASCCVDFCNDFNLEKRSGFIKYIDICLSKITSTTRLLQKMVNMFESVSNHYQAILDIEMDPNPTETREAHDIYCMFITKHTGLAADYSKTPITYLYFIEVCKVTDELGIPIDIYMKAQFEGLSWANSYPEPPQLVGDKAIKRLNKYMFENKIKKSDKNVRKDSKSLIDALKNISKNGKGNNRGK